MGSVPRPDSPGGSYGTAPPPLSLFATGIGSSLPRTNVNTATSIYGWQPAARPDPIMVRLPRANSPFEYDGIPPSLRKVDLSFMNESCWKETWSRAATEAVLQKGPDKSAIVRPSSTPETYCVTFRDGAEVLHKLVETEMGRFAITDTAGIWHS